MLRTKVLELLRAILGLLREGISSEEAQRAVLAVLAVLKSRATTTPTVVDDAVIGVAIYLAENYWQVIWPVRGGEVADVDGLSAACEDYCRQAGLSS